MYCKLQSDEYCLLDTSVSIRDFSEAIVSVADFTPFKSKIEALLYIMVHSHRPIASKTMLSYNDT